MNAKHIVYILSLAITISISWWLGNFYWKNLRGAWVALEKPPKDITKEIPPAIDNIDMPLILPPGFSISIFAKDLPGARVIKQDQFGNFWVSRPSDGAVTLLSVESGVVTHQGDILINLHKPHGLAFDPKYPGLLYIAEEDKISRIATYSDQGKPEKILDLPVGGNHNLHTIGFGPDDRLYVKIGSTCNVCNESDERRAKIYSMNRDGGDFKEFARGLRNAPFFTWHYDMVSASWRMWATEMGRDLLGDDTPPDEINIIEQSKNYGWPNCYGKNILDANFHKDDHLHIVADCSYTVPSHIDIPAHSAPLGLAFVPEESLPQEYWYNLFVAYHGSWNRTTPTGYKVVRMKLDAKGKYFGTEDFITGWLTPEGALGRPVDIFIQPGGTMYITDDKAGVIYQVMYNRK